MVTYVNLIRLISRLERSKCAKAIPETNCGTLLGVDPMVNTFLFEQGGLDLSIPIGTFIIAVATLLYMLYQDYRSQQRRNALLRQFTSILQIETVLRKNEKTATPRYFRPNHPWWIDFGNGYVYERSEAGNILQALLRNENRFFVIEGEKGTGKTVCSEIVAYRLSATKRMFKKKPRVLLMRDARDLTREKIDRYISGLKELFDDRDTLLIVDECHFNPKECEYLAEQLYANTRNVKTLFVTRLSYERAVELERDQPSRVYEFAKTFVYRMSPAATEEIIEWFGRRILGRDLRIETVQELVNIAGRDLIYTGRILLAWRELMSRSPRVSISDKMLKEYAYDSILSDLDLLRNSHQEAPKTMLLISIFYMFQISPERSFLQELTGVDEDCFDLLAKRGEIEILPDGRISMGHPSEARFNFESCRETNSSYFRELELSFGRLPDDLFARYLVNRWDRIKRRDLRETSAERESLRDEAINLSFGLSYERELLRTLLSDKLKIIEGFLTGDPDDALMWARVAWNVGCMDQAKTLKEIGVTLIDSKPESTGREAWLHAAIVCRDLEEEDAARRLLERCLVLHPDYSKARFVYANLLSRKPQQVNEAKKQYEIVLRELRDSVTLSRAATFFSHNGDPDLAERLFEEATDDRNFQRLPEEKTIPILTAYSYYLISQSRFTNVAEYISRAKAISIRRHRNPSIIHLCEARLCERRGKLDLAERSYIKAVEHHEGIVDSRAAHLYADFLLRYGQRISNKSEAPKYPKDSAARRAVEVLRGWLDESQDKSPADSIAVAHHQLGNILYSRFDPPDFVGAERELQKAYIVGPGSGNLQDAQTDNLFGNLLWAKHKAKQRKQSHLLEQAEKFLRLAFESVYHGEVSVEEDSRAHIIIAGGGLAEFLWKEKKEKFEGEADSIFYEIVKRARSLDRLTGRSLLAKSLCSYANFKLALKQFPKAQSLLDEALLIDGRNPAALITYARLLESRAHVAGSSSDLVAAVQRYFDVLKLESHRTRVEGENIRVVNVRYESACIELTKLLRNPPFKKPRSAIRILEYVFQANKHGLHIALELTRLIDHLADKTNLSKVEDSLARHPDDAFCWYLRAIKLHKNRGPQEEIRKSFNRAYELLGTDSCRDELFNRTNLSVWIR